MSDYSYHQSLRLQNLTAFKDITLEFVSGVNALVGVAALFLRKHWISEGALEGHVVRQVDPHVPSNAATARPP